MPKKNKEKEKRLREAKWNLEIKRRQKQLADEKAIIEQYRKLSNRIKESLRSLGCDLPFYELLDSCEIEFHRLAAWAKDSHKSLHDVFEVGNDELDDETNWARLGIPSDWEQVFFTCTDDLAQSYVSRDRSANLRGLTTGFLDRAGGFHTIIQIIKNPKCQFEHQEYKYLMKLAVLLHEIGHVDDFERKVNFDFEKKTADLIEGEVYANIFALTECFQRGYHLSGSNFLEALLCYQDHTDHRGEVARRLVERFLMPSYKKWTDYV